MTYFDSTFVVYEIQTRGRQTNVEGSEVCHALQESIERLMSSKRADDSETLAWKEMMKYCTESLISGIGRCAEVGKTVVVH